jgi:ArsR family transcriptional regulator
MMKQAGAFALGKPLYEIKANLFKGLAHPVRVRILEVLSGAVDAVAVGELLDDTGLEASHLSQHLSVLRRHGLVTSDRRGSAVYYRLAQPEVAELLRVARGLLVGMLELNRAQLDSSARLPAL